MSHPVSTAHVSRQRAGPHVVRRGEHRAVVDPQGTIPITGAGPSAAHDEGCPRRPDPALLEALPPGYAVLVLQRGPKAGESLTLDSERTLVGRHADADICLDHVTVSRRHAELLPHEGGHMIRDVGSLNGTYVNGQRVDAAALRPGDVVQIGKYRLAYFPVC